MNMKTLSRAVFAAAVSLLWWIWPEAVAEAHHCGDFSDCFSTLRTAISATVGVSMLAILVSTGLDFVPVIGQIKGVIEAITGKDIITGEELKTHERLLGIVGPAGRVFGLAAAVSRRAGAIEDISSLSRVTSRLPSTPGSATRQTSDTARRALDGSTVYVVDESMHAADMAAGVLRGGSYVKNPTARRLADLITESGRIGSKQMSGRFMYVVDQNGDIIIGTRGGQRMPHPTLIGGENPQVRAAGMVDIRGGKIYSVDNASGHFKPGPESLRAAEEAFNKLPPSVFRRDFRGYLPFDG